MLRNNNQAIQSAEQNSGNQNLASNTCMNNSMNMNMNSSTNQNVPVNSVTPKAPTNKNGNINSNNTNTNSNTTYPRIGKNFQCHRTEFFFLSDAESR